MKKLLLVIVLSFFLLVGCGNNEDIPVVNPDDTPTNNTTGENNNDLEDIKLYSDDTKMVFDMSGYKAAYYYSGNEITKVESYYEYENHEVALTAKAVYETEPDESIESVTVKGKYIVITMKPSEYEGLTTEEVKQTFSYLKQIYEND